MPRRRDCTKSERESSDDRKKMVSWVLAMLSVVGSRMPRLALDLSTEGRTAERAEVKLLRVLSEVVIRTRNKRQ